MKHLIYPLLLALTGLSCDQPEPTEPDQLPPNVLLIMSDDLNNDLGFYGHELVQSPNLDALASESLVFDRAYCQYPVCSPSRSSMLTGLYPEQSGVISNAGRFREHVPAVKTLPQWFKENGYTSARIGKMYHYGVPLMIGTPGVDDSLSWDITVNPRGIDRDSLDLVHTIEEGKYGGTLSWLNIESTDDDHTDGKAALAAIDLLNELHPDETGKPFFLGLGFYRPHTPYVAPPMYFDIYPEDEIDPVMMEPGERDDVPIAALNDRKYQLDLTVDQRKEIIQAYYATVSFLDAQVGRVMTELSRLGLRDNTIVIFASDHGYHLGQKGLWQKSDLFEGSARVPLLVSKPGQKAAIRTGQVVELLDLYPTLIEMTGLPNPGHLKGTSLTPLFENADDAVRESAFTMTHSRARSTRPEFTRETIMGYTVRTPRYRYTTWGDGVHGTELYDYATDPRELTNLAGNPDLAETETRLASLLAEHRRTASTPQNATNQP